MGLLFRFCPVDVITAPRGFCSVRLLFLTLCFHPGCYLIAQCGSRCSRSQTTSEAAKVKGKPFISILSWRKNLDFTWTLLRCCFFRFDCSLDVVNLGISLCYQTCCYLSPLMLIICFFFFFVRKEKLLNANSGLLLEWSHLTALMKGEQATEVAF